MRKMMAAFGAALALALTTAVAAAQDKPKICFVYVGPHNDGGRRQLHEDGRLMVDEKLRDKVETSYVENVPEGPDAERAIERLARGGCALIFTTSFGFMDPTIKVAEKFPDVKFEHATGFKTAANVTTYNARFYEGRYIIGQIAGKMSKAGSPVTSPLPDSRGGDGHQLLHARRAVGQSGLKVKIVWVNSWFDPGKEADAPKALSTGRRHSGPAHRLPAGCRSPRSAGCTVLARRTT